MVSFDVKSLFTNVSVGKALEVIHEKLIADDSCGEDSTVTTSDHQAPPDLP